MKTRHVLRFDIPVSAVSIFQKIRSNGTELRRRQFSSSNIRHASTYEPMYSIHRVLFALLPKRDGGLVQELSVLATQPSDVLVTGIIGVGKSKARVEWFDAGNHFRDFEPIVRVLSRHARSMCDNMTHRISLVSIADFCSSGGMNSLANVGTPENALRTKLKCLAFA